MNPTRVETRVASRVGGPIGSPREWIGKGTLESARWRKLPKPVRWFNGTVLAVGTEFKVFSTRDHGWFIIRDAVGGRKIYQD